MTKKMNLGCGLDIKDGWTNVDTKLSPGVEYADARYSLPYQDYDFILINHVLCTMTPSDANMVLRNAYMALRTGGQLQVIDVDLLKAFQAYQQYNYTALPIFDMSDIDGRLCMHISGYGTRLSHYTPVHLSNLLRYVGFHDNQIMYESEYDTRPMESVVVEGVK